MVITLDLFHLVVVVVLCEVGQARVDVGSKQRKVDLDLAINIFAQLFHNPLPALRKAQGHPQSHQSHGFQLPWPCT